MVALKEKFRKINHFHVHRIFNSKADELSKAALGGHLGWLYVATYIQGTLLTREHRFVF